MSNFNLRAFSGQVSWDKQLALGSTYQENDETITHHIIDRPLAGKTYINRVYVQPQWVFDCINENMLLPVDNYLPGAVLPPHLSPFTETNESGYVPPEKQRLNKLKLGLKIDEEVVDQQQQYQNGADAASVFEENNKKDSKLNKKETVELKNSKSKLSQKSETNNTNNKKTNNKKSESQESEQEEKDESDEEEDDMAVDIDTPDEEQSETEEEVFSETDEEEKKKNNRTEVKVEL
jgi:pescadillo protein